jgi:cytochrome c oxidase subunit II
MSSMGLRLSIAAAVWLAAGAAAANQYNLPEPQSIIAREIYDLHTLIMWIIVGIFVVVFGAMTYAIVKHRKSASHRTEQFHKNTTVEIVWTIIPFIILIGMAYPATRTVFAMKDTSSADKNKIGAAADDPSKTYWGDKTGNQVQPAEVKALRE